MYVRHHTWQSCSQVTLSTACCDSCRRTIYLSAYRYKHTRTFRKPLLKSGVGPASGKRVWRRVPPQRASCRHLLSRRQQRRSARRPRGPAQALRDRSAGCGGEGGGCMRATRSPWGKPLVDRISSAQRHAHTSPGAERGRNKNARIYFTRAQHYLVALGSDYLMLRS